MADLGGGIGGLLPMIGDILLIRRVLAGVWAVVGGLPPMMIGDVLLIRRVGGEERWALIGG